jgi:hypothetical protein
MMDDWGRSRQVMGLAQPNLRWARIMLGLVHNLGWVRPEFVLVFIFRFFIFLIILQNYTSV